MPTLASLNVEVGAEISGLEAGMNKVGSVLDKVGQAAAAAGRSIGSGLSAAFDKAGQSVDKFNSSLISSYSEYDKVFNKLDKGIGRLGSGLKDVGENLSTYVTLPLTLLAGGAVKAYGDLQALEKGFNAVYKGAGPAADELARLKDVAKLPGLGLKEAYQGSINLQAVGFSAEQSRKTLAAFGNALATVGKGKADLDGVTLALTQIASKGKISAEELNQIAERVPQIRKVLSNVFGTADSEELTKLGIGAEEFVSKVTAELGKLPPVTGGINNAFENMADAGFIALSKLGKALNDNFNVEGLLNTIGDTINSAIAAFDNLSPSVQKAIFIFAGVAAAAGPVLLAVSAIVSALPTLAAGFAVITGPIGIAAAAIAAAAYLIITNWDAVVAYFQSSGIGSVFSELAASVESAFNSLVGYIQSFAAIVEPIWNGIVDIFGTGLGEALRFAGTVLSAAFDLFTRILNVGGALLRGDWAKVWEGLGNVVIAVLNGITRILTKFFSGTIKVFGSIAKAVGNDTLAKSFNSGAASVEAYGKSLLKAYLGTEKVAESAKKAAATIAEIPQAGEQTFTRTPKEGKAKAPKKLDVKEVPLNYHLSTTGFKNAIKEIEKQQDAVGNKQGFELPVKLSLPENVAQQFDAFKEQVRAGMTNTRDIVFETTAVIQQGLGSAFEGVGNLIADAFTGDLGGAEGFFKGLLGIVADFAGNFGKSLIAAGVAALAFQNLLINPIAAIAAGTALVALAGVAKNILKKGPAGGGASAGASGGGGATGTPRSTYTSPALTASAPKASSAAGKVEFEIEGSKLKGVLRTVEYNMGRTT